VLLHPLVSVWFQSPQVESITALGPETQARRRNCSGFFTGMGFQSAASIKAKMAVLAPIPSASDRIATIVNTGDCRSMRKAYLRSARKSSSRRKPTASRHSSFLASTAPNSTRARQRASFCERPLRIAVAPKSYLRHAVAPSKIQSQ
jgi:hypothetical protein